MFEMFLPNLPTLAIMLGITLGGLWIFKRTNVKQLGELQESIIAAQEKQIAILTKKVQRLEAIFTTLQITLKKRRGLLIEISDDLITLIDQRTGTEQSVKIHIDSGELDAIDKKEKEA